MKILIACEFSGIVRRAFREKGLYAFSCDLLPAEDKSKYHIQCDVLEIISEDWDLMIAHPPCTYLARSGMRWLYHPKHPNRHKYLQEAYNFFEKLFFSPIKHICIENPLGIVSNYIPHTQIIHPWQFGHDEVKTTCLWLKNLPHLTPTNIVEGRKQRIFKDCFNLPPSIRWKERSRTYLGIARAMAEQWGKL